MSILRLRFILFVWVVLACSAMLPACKPIETPAGVGAQGTSVKLLTPGLPPPTKPGSFDFTNTPPPPPSSTPTIAEGSPYTPSFPPLSPSPEISSWRFKVAYLSIKTSLVPSNLEAKIWILEPPYQAPKLAYEFGPDEGFAGNVDWNHKGTQIDFVKFVHGRVILVILDVPSLKKREITLPAIGNFSGSAMYWSLDDEWIAYTVRQSDIYQSPETVLFNLKSEQYKQLGTGTDFIAWSDIKPDQYLLLKYNYRVSSTDGSFDKIEIALRQVESNTPLSIIADMGDRAPKLAADYSWSPDGKIVIAINGDALGGSDIFELDLEKSQSSLLPYHLKVSNPII